MSQTKSQSNIVNSIIGVFNDEINTLEKIKENIAKDEKLCKSFEKAVWLIHDRCSNDKKGKVIFTGVGKSGQIAKKIAATFSSTGTKSLYIHPVEGMHGDLGIVEAKDTLVAISKGGKSDEVLSMIPFFKNFDIPIISITADMNSELAKVSDIILFMEIEKEACPLDLAPTSSTTASLVIGDALAVALMREKNFQKHHFAIYHPAGKLGKRLLTRVKDIMMGGGDNPLVHLEDTMKKVIEVVTSKSLGAVSVVDDDNNFCGLITDYDIRIHLDTDIFTKKAKDIMNPSPTFVYEDTMAVDALILMENRERPFNVLPVLNKNKKAIGMIRLHDLIKAGL